MSTPAKQPPGPTPPAPTNPPSLIPADGFDSVVNTVLDSNKGMAAELAERIVSEGIKFVVTGALRPELAMAPSRIVDEGWHALIVHTKLYEDLCARFGPFVHHSPGYDPEFFDPDILEQTQAAIRAAGFEVDEDLWRPPTDDSLVSVTAGCQHAPSKDGPIKPMPKPEFPCRTGTAVVR